MGMKFNVEVEENVINYLERLGMEVDAQVYLIDRMFANHAYDTDTELFESIPFKHFMRRYEESKYAWEMAKSEFQKTYLDPIVAEKIGKQGVAYNWIIPDFSAHVCEVTVS